MEVEPPLVLHQSKKPGMNRVNKPFNTADSLAISSWSDLER